MGIDWEKSLKQYIIKKFKEKLGIDVPLSAIAGIELNFSMDFSDVELRDLGMMYALSIMAENYEATANIDKELKKRNCTVKLNLDEKKGEGTVDIFMTPKQAVENIQINLIVTPDGMMVDWDKEDF